VRELTKTIVEHVALIKRLANEFSEYGRMPTAKFLSTDISTLLTNSVETLRVQYPGIDVALEINGKIPEMLLDPDQIRGAFINILDNAVAALSATEEKGGAAPSKSIVVRATFDKQKREALIEFCDYGVGISAKDKNRIFEPYYTTKQGGTGLGLAIVSSVISDHQGDIRVFDNYPGGTKFVVTLPQHPRPATLRRLTSS
jgi:two-component system, NtrC family, nitrogen regulation sensor histidine kinase NtrY